jgi:hypothetical protein
MTNQATPQKKKMSTGQKILIGLGVLILMGSTTNCGSDGNASTSSATGETKEASGSASTEKKWTEVYTLKGNGTKNSASFHLSGGKARLKYSYKTDMGLFSVYVMPEGQDLMKEGGFPEIMTEKSESSETYITKEEGNYYMNINSSGGDWTVTVEEEK